MRLDGRWAGARAFTLSPMAPVLPFCTGVCRYNWQARERERVRERAMRERESRGRKRKSETQRDSGKETIREGDNDKERKRN